MQKFYGDVGVSFIDSNKYNPLPNQFRVLYHETLNKILRYRNIPRRTINFDFYPLYKKTNNNTVSLEGTITTISDRFIDDTVIQEIWLADDISMEAAFFYELFNFFQSDISVGDNLIWWPKDKTDKAFTIIPIDIQAGGSDETNINPFGEKYENDYRFLREEVKVLFKIVNEISIPEAILTLEGV